MSQVDHDVDTDEEEDEQIIPVFDDDVDLEDDDDNVGNRVDDKEDDEESDEELDARVAGNVDEFEDDDEGDGDKAGKKSRRQRQREAKERNGRELKYLRKRNKDLEIRFSRLEASVDQRMTGNEMASIEQGITKATADLRLADETLAEAVEENDGKKYTEALSIRDDIRDNLRDLQNAKAYYEQGGGRPAPDQGDDVDPRHRAHVESFMRANDWFDVNGGDADSRHVLMIDSALEDEGYDPTTKEYWDLLAERVREELPHHYDADDDEDDDVDDEEERKPRGKAKTQKKRNRGPTFRTNGRDRPLQPNEVRVSKERIDAMKEAGLWDDPVARNSMLKRYAEFDKEAAEGGR